MLLLKYKWSESSWSQSGFFKRKSHDRKQPHRGEWWRWRWQCSSIEASLRCLWASSATPPAPLDSALELSCSPGRRSTSRPSCKSLAPPLVLIWKRQRQWGKSACACVTASIYVFTVNVLTLHVHRFGITVINPVVLFKVHPLLRTVPQAPAQPIQLHKQHDTWVGTNYL